MILNDGRGGFGLDEVPNQQQLVLPRFVKALLTTFKLTISPFSYQKVLSDCIPCNHTTLLLLKLLGTFQYLTSVFLPFLLIYMEDYEMTKTNTEKISVLFLNLL